MNDILKAVKYFYITYIILLLNNYLDLNIELNPNLNIFNNYIGTIDSIYITT